MVDAISSRRIVRFGVFEVDLQTGELRKNGLKLKLQEQPFQILALLLERPGEVVTREELRQKLWSNDTFVDFDHGLNISINKIRQALADSAENSRFIETLARRGYRFIAPIDEVSRRSHSQEPLSDASHGSNFAKACTVDDLRYSSQLLDFLSSQSEDYCLADGLATGRTCDIFGLGRPFWLGRMHEPIRL